MSGAPGRKKRKANRKLNKKHPPPAGGTLFAKEGRDRGAHRKNTAGWNAASISTVAVGTLIITASLAIALKLLLSIKKEETPFNIKNVKRLKAIAMLIMMLEPYQFIAERLFNKLNPLFVDGNVKVTVHTSWGGSILTAGLVIYCVSLVFEYGVLLQNQVDETL